MPWSWFVAGSRPQSWIRLLSITTSTAVPQPPSEPRPKQMLVWLLVTSFPVKVIRSPVTIGLERLPAFVPSRFRSAKTASSVVSGT